jgi:Icc-related predicted phosphoesterase
MRIIATSDLHGSLPEIDECDILIIAGDVCPDFIEFSYGSRMKMVKGEQKQAKWLDKEFRPWLESLPAKNIVGIAGNHDFVFESYKFLIKNLDLPWVYLEDTARDIEGLRIHGTPWVPNLESWAFYQPRNHKKFDLIPDDCDIVVSHGPMYGYGDQVRDGRSVGCPTLLKRVEEVKPKLLICGHIHEGYGHYRAGDCDVYNVALNDELYDPVNEPVVIDID